MTLGDIIKAYRTEHNLSMDAFSEKSGISKAYISLLEKNKHPKTGKSIAPSIQCIKQAALGMDMDFNNLFSMLDGEISLESTLSNTHLPLYKILKKIMEDKNLTIANIAKMCNLPDSTVRGIIKREQNTVALDVAFKLANGLNVSLEYLNGLPENKLKSTPKKENLFTTNKYITSSDDMNFLTKYHALDYIGKEHVQTVLGWETDRILAQDKPEESFEHLRPLEFQNENIEQPTRFQSDNQTSAPIPDISALFAEDLAALNKGAEMLQPKKQKHSSPKRKY